MSKLAETRRINEIKAELGNENFEIKYQKVAYWQGQPVVVGKNELEGFYFELAGEGINHKYHHSYLENALTDSRKIFNDYFRKLEMVKLDFLYGDNKGNLEACYDEMLRCEDEFQRYNN